MQTHRCHVPGAAGPHVTLPDDEAHHIRHVLRLGVGADLVVFDGAGREWDAQVASVARQAVTVHLRGARQPVPEPPVSITLVVGWLKGDQMSTVVRDATALGVNRIVPCATQHVSVSASARQAPVRERLARIASSSASQCGRAVVPGIGDVSSFDEALAAADPVRILCVEPGLAAGSTLSAFDGQRAKAATVFVGPEGGWSEHEVAEARAAGATLLSLGPRTLRAEIAPTVALSVLWARWGWV